jgi:hypothetical protein
MALAHCWAGSLTVSRAGNGCIELILSLSV